MNRKFYLTIILILVMANMASFYFYLPWGKNWQKEKKDMEKEFSKLNEDYKNTVSELKNYEIKSDSLMEKAVMLQAEKNALAEKIISLQTEKEKFIEDRERLSAPEYLADIVRDRVRLGVEVKALEEKIQVRDNVIASLVKEREKLQALLGKEKHLSQRLSSSMAEEKKKGFSSELLLKDRVRGLEKIVLEKDVEIKSLEKKLKGAYSQNKILEEKLAQAKEEKELLEEELTATKRLYEEAKANSETLSAKLLETSEKAIQLDEKLENLELSLAQSETGKKELEKKHEMAEKKYEELQDKNIKEDEETLKVELTKTISLPRANILAASEKYKFIIFDIGEEDGVKIGDRFSVCRDGGKIGEVEVARIRSRSSFANIVSSMEGITITTKDTIK